MLWSEHRNPEGRTYWYNQSNKQSVWEKPEELKTPFERALGQTKWKEYVSGGRKYFYNTDTKESKWDTPDEILLLADKVEKETAAADIRTPTPGFNPIQGASSAVGAPDPSSSASQLQPMNGTDNAVGLHTGGVPFTTANPLPARPLIPGDPVVPHNGFLNPEDGEKAFVHLLRKSGVDATWTWDQTMRAIVTDPLYKALNSLAEKKASWLKFTDNLRVKEREEREARLAKLRPTLRNMLKGNPSVHHYSTFATADKLFQSHPTWQQGRIEAERKMIFDEYVQELKTREVQDSRNTRSRSIGKVVNMFTQLNVDVTTRWRTAQELIMQSPEWKNDSELRKLPTLDILLAFEDYSRVREREFEEQMRRSQVEKTRKERKAREAFKALLQERVESGLIKARTKWKEIYPTFSSDERYRDMLGNPGSNPLELFWDVVDTLDQKLDDKISLVDQAVRAHNAVLQPKYDEETEAIDKADAAKSKKEEEEGGSDPKIEVAAGMEVDHVPIPPRTVALFSVKADTTEDEFFSVVKGASGEPAKRLSDEDLRLVFNSMHAVALKKQSDDKRRAERKQRHLLEDLRYALKKMPDPLDVTMSYEAAVPLIEHLPEYKAIEDEEARRTAFAKFVKRQKERKREPSEDGASATSRKRKESTRDKESLREKEHHSSSSKTHDRERSSRHHERDHEKDGYRSSKHDDRGRDREREKSRRGDDGRRRESRRGSSRDDGYYDDGSIPYGKEEVREEPVKPKKLAEKRDLEDKGRERADKRAKYDRFSEGGEDTPEEGEI